MIQVRRLVVESIVDVMFWQ